MIYVGNLTWTYNVIQLFTPERNNYHFTPNEWQKILYTYSVFYSINQYSLNNKTVRPQFRQTETYYVQQPTEQLNK